MHIYQFHEEPSRQQLHMCTYLWICFLYSSSLRLQPGGHFSVLPVPQLSLQMTSILKRGTFAWIGLQRYLATCHSYTLSSELTLFYSKPGFLVTWKSVTSSFDQFIAQSFVISSVHSFLCFNIVSCNIVVMFKAIAIITFYFLVFHWSKPKQALH